MGSRCARWCYTLNNPEEGDKAKLLSLETVYHVVGREVGDLGTPHLPGCSILVVKQRLDTLKRAVDVDAVYFEPMRGTPKQAGEYCKKGGDFVETGKCPAGNGKRTRDEVARDLSAATEAGSIAEFAEENAGVWM
ncbi:Replication-associated protein [Porphyridium purpureum]|uniref:Replication-associated protein n=1 Tax=Porphyridium purpureum TaxID=35688 RepID=A0A5J4Z8I5_PORPP|nr:Replication-associated protein [Porphyridium purpureum]|eukprot:POR9579..scf295_1